MSEMKAIQITGFGSAQNLSMAEISQPLPGPGEMLVEQEASNLNPLDLMIRRGGYPTVPTKKLPHVGERDVAGRVVAVGAEVDAEWVGQQVFGAPDFTRGAFA